MGVLFNLNGGKSKSKTLEYTLPLERFSKNRFLFMMQSSLYLDKLQTADDLPDIDEVVALPILFPNIRISAPLWTERLKQIDDNSYYFSHTRI